MVDIIVSAAADMIAHALELLVSLIMPVFSFDFTMFNDVFPFAAQAYSIIQRIGLGITLLLAAFQVFPLLFQSKRSTSTPVRVLVFAVLAVAGIYYGNYILEWIMKIAEMPYYALMKSYAADNSVNDFLSGISFAPVSLAIETVTMGTSIQASVLLYIILLLMIGIAFIKLLLEAVERYVILFVLVYLSPLASSTLASETISGIFKKYFSMFVSQCILLILNIWCIEMFISMLANLSTGSATPMIALLMGYALLRIAAKMDSYLNQLGLNSAITGVGLGGELMATGMMLMSRMSPFGATSTGTGGTGAAGGVAGMAQRLSDTARRFTPTGPAQDVVGGFARSVGNGFTAGAAAASEAEGGYLDKLRAAGTAGFDSGKTNFQGNREAASQEGAKTNLWSRAIYTDGADHPGMDLLGQDELTPSDLNDIATSTYLGDDIMQNLSDGAIIEDPSTVAATMQSIGYDNLSPEAKEAVTVGYGNAAAENISYTAGENGIHAQYERDGRIHDLDIKTAAQFGALTPQEQQAYTSFKNKEGSTYYYKSDTQRVVNSQQKQQAAQEQRIMNAAKTFGTDSGISSADWAAAQNFRPAMKNQLMTDVYDSYAANNDSATLPDTAEVRAMVADRLDAMDCRTLGLNQKDISAFSTKLRSGEAHVIHESARGTQVEYKDGNRHRTFTLVTNHAMESPSSESNDKQNRDQYSPEYLGNRGFSLRNVGRDNYYATQIEDLPEDQLAKKSQRIHLGKSND